MGITENKAAKTKDYKTNVLQIKTILHLKKLRTGWRKVGSNYRYV